MYNDQNDYELLYLVSENNEDAKELFYKKYKPIIEMKASKYKKYAESKGYDFNDLVQEGMIGLSQAINDFSEQKDVQFNTFANFSVKIIPLSESLTSLFVFLSLLLKYLSNSFASIAT